MDLQGIICKNCNAPEDYCPDVANCSTVRAITEYFRNLESRWISVDDRLPEPGQYVLQWGESVVDKYRGLGESTMMAGQLINENGHRWADFGVTHWMPLPNPPQAE